VRKAATDGRDEKNEATRKVNGRSSSGKGTLPVPHPDPYSAVQD
jgi:hypothetical protein